jgi:hypothetical protein
MVIGVARATAPNKVIVAKFEPLTNMVVDVVEETDREQARTLGGFMVNSHQEILDMRFDHAPHDVKYTTMDRGTESVCNHEFASTRCSPVSDLPHWVCSTIQRSQYLIEGPQHTGR